MFPERLDVFIKFLIFEVIVMLKYFILENNISNYCYETPKYNSLLIFTIHMKQSMDRYCPCYG